MLQQNKNQKSHVCGWKVYLCSLLFLTLLISLPAAARNPNDTICFPVTIWSGTGSPNVTQGYTLSDTGWRGAFRYLFGSGSTTPNAIVQGVRDPTNTNLYLAVQVNNLQNWDPDSAVVLAFDPDGTNAHMQMLVIYPIQQGASPTHLSPSSYQEVDYYHGYDPTNGWGSVGTGMNPGWVQIYTNYSGSSATSTAQWNMAAQLPIDPTGINGIAAPSSGTFGFYINVLAFPNEPPTDPPGTVAAVPFAWPTDAPLIAAVGCANPMTCIFTQPNTLPPSTAWGNSTISPTATCQGVSISSQTGNIYTNQGLAAYNGVNEPVINLTPGAQNIFSAYVQNTMVDTMGNPVVAQGVRATFKIANFGIPGPNSWIKPGNEPGGSPIAGDPTPMNVNVPSSGAANACAGATNNNLPACTLSTGAWVLNLQEQNAYNTPATNHQCVLVELDATSPGSNTIILNNTAAQNMNFKALSKMDDVAEISANGHPLPPGMTDQLFDIGVSTRSETLDSDRVAQATTGGGKGSKVSLLTWEAFGCRHTNTFLTIRNKRIEICQSVGGFGYIAHHTSSVAVKDWKQELTGPNLVKTKDNVYSIHIPHNGAARVNTTIEALEVPPPPPCGKSKSTVAPFASLLGILAVGLVSYRRKNRKS